MRWFWGELTWMSYLIERRLLFTMNFRLPFHPKFVNLQSERRQHHCVRNALSPFAKNKYDRTVRTSLILFYGYVCKAKHFAICNILFLTEAQFRNLLGALFR